MFLTKKYIKKINKNAFTLIELSVVILVISVMVVGVLTSKSLIAKSRLANAKSLTRQSVINDMGDDLIAWYETSLEDSFKPSEIKTDASVITLWKDSNKNAVNKNDATAVVSPTLVQNVFYNSIPGVRFTGSQYLTFNGTKFAKNSYTVFVVEQRSTGESGYYNSFISSNIRAGGKRLSLGYYGSNQILQSHFSNDLQTTVTNYKPQTPSIHTFLFNNTIGKQYTLNGKNPTTPNNQFDPLNSFESATIGYHQGPTQTYYYKGDLAEIIMFKRSLKTEEVEAIESYLGSKYGIPVS
jgi:prepilin-type N-terminal cleavage/methylation domain-containing protein